MAAVGSRKARASHPLGTWGHNSGCPLSVVGRGALLLEAELEPRACMTGLGPPRQSTAGPGTVCAACFPAASLRGLQTPPSPRVPTCSPPVVSVSSSPLLQRTPVTLSQGHPSALLLTQLKQRRDQQPESYGFLVGCLGRPLRGTDTRKVLRKLDRSVQGQGESGGDLQVRMSQIGGRSPPGTPAAPPRGYA